MSDPNPLSISAPELGSKAGRALLHRIEGDSMLPTYKPGGTAIVDPECGYIGGGVYLIQDGSRAFLRRLERIGRRGRPRVWLFQDNPTYLPEAADLTDVHIVGRVCGVLAQQ